MHINWSLCLKLYISAPKDMEQAANMFIRVSVSVVSGQYQICVLWLLIDIGICVLYIGTLLNFTTYTPCTCTYLYEGL